MRTIGLLSILAACAVAASGCELESTKNRNERQEAEQKAAAPVKAPPTKASDGEAPGAARPAAKTGSVRAPTKEDLATYTQDLKGSGPLMVTIKTSMGDFHCELFEKQAPMTVANFVGLGRGLHTWRHPQTGAVMKQPYYDGIIFHRVIPGFMIQTGDPLGKGSGGPGYQFGDEITDLKHDKPAMLSMANAGPGTNGSQFFITEVPTKHLDGKHTVFGQCKEAELVKKIARVPSSGSRPNDEVKITGMEFSRGG